MKSNAITVLTTVSNEQQADDLIKVLLESRLAACIQTQNIGSHYVWEGKVCHDEEVLLIIKSTNEAYSRLERTIIANHEYEVPQIVALPIEAGFRPYLNWLKQNVKP
ncbi:divalent-cation tolerance protein CutA [Vibrio mediterranei]|jgi:periplasmic divalent cation tolerance protein|uniref:Cytochrome C biogenesis protein n=1 Tax=Vibrio mediterranei TaxID=689 RepID=A0ABX5D7B8_9VIBR|nr:divalent-cation tolerance protein CutA [Vibrio mediterranei]MCG9628158.1 divalent-cation tolerance protein CutA [Vibrio mediterranei]MCG9658666.1 divalent-cation tolerance protein CutA [Vibrio mediterranei]MCG9662699.1 divalent-cation tolerance protein CutA [Vibrio mediterranei]NOI22724.1 divalent-cation tolerance protein CutA [Vibrio mediterranei]PCD88325.1 cytochrome C biogenesis protein [Vibrio mediterranei]